MRRAPLLTLCVVALGCPQPITTVDELGPGAGSGRDASVADATPTDRGPAPVDAGDHDAGVRPPDTGTPDTGTLPPADAGLAALRWGQATVPANIAPVQAVWGRAADEVYAGTGHGKILRYDGAAWTEMFQTSSNLGITALSGTATRLFAASEVALNIIDGQDTWRHIVPRVRQITGLWAVSNDEVYLTVEEQNGTSLQRYSGGNLTEVFRPMGVGSLEDVWADAGGRLWICGTGGSLFVRDNGITTAEPVEWPAGWGRTEIANFTFGAIRGVGDALYAVGSRFLIFRRGADGVWRIDHDPFLTNPLTALAGFVAGAHTEIYATGRGTSAGPMLRFYDGQWRSAGVDDNLHLFGIWAAGPDDYFAVGMVRNTVRGVILRGVR